MGNADVVFGETTARQISRDDRYRDGGGWIGTALWVP